MLKDVFFVDSQHCVGQEFFVRGAYPWRVRSQNLTVCGSSEYRISSNSSRASNKRRASNTGRVSNRSPVFVYSVLYSRCIVGIRVLSTVQPVYSGGPSRLYQ